MLEELAKDDEKMDGDHTDANQIIKDRRRQEARYFKLYGRIEIHEWLLKDSVRIKAYREAIQHNEFFRHKVGRVVHVFKQIPLEILPLQDCPGCWLRHGRSFDVRSQGGFQKGPGSRGGHHFGICPTGSPG